MNWPWSKRSLENPAIPLSSASIVSILGGGLGTAAGVDVTEDTALRLMAVWRAVNLIAGTISTLPLEVYRATVGGRVEIHPPLFDDPVFPDTTWQEFLETLLLNVLVNGNGYALKIMNEGGDRVARVLGLDPTRVHIGRRAADAANPSGKTFTVRGMGDQVFTPAEIMHVPGISRDGVVGLSPIAYARQAIGSALAAEEVAGKLFSSGLLNAGIVQADGDLTEADVAQIKQRYRETMTGLVRSLEVLVLSAGLKFTPTTIPPRDAQWLETRQFAVQEIARLYGVPADLLMDNSATGNTAVEQRTLAWVKFGLRRPLANLEHRLSMHLLPRGQFCEFNLDGLLRGDSKTQAEVFTMAVNGGWLLRSEVREIMNLPVIAGIDDPPKLPAPAPVAGEPTGAVEQGDPSVV